jgi:hypothetical protein
MKSRRPAPAVTLPTASGDEDGGRLEPVSGYADGNHDLGLALVRRAQKIGK